MDATMADERAHIIFSGRVQGVFFRAHTQDVAYSLGLRGWVRNMPDGRVEAVMEGPRDKIDEAIAMCTKGPPAARVADVAVDWQEPRGEESFHVKHF
jgi:acylphosphatase